MKDIQATSVVADVMVLRATYFKLELALQFISKGWLGVTTVYAVAAVPMWLVHPYLFLMVVVSYLVWSAGAAFACWRMAYSRENRKPFLPRRYIFQNERIVVKSAKSEWVWKWDVFRYWSKKAGCYLLYTRENAFKVIPQSSVLVQDREVFETLLRTKLKKR